MPDESDLSRALGGGSSRQRTRSDTLQEIAELDKKVAVLDKVVDSLTELRPKRPPWGAIIGTMISIAFPIGFIIFAAGEYPKRLDFKELVGETSKRDEALQSKVNSLELEIARLRGLIDLLGGELDAVGNDINRLRESKQAPRKR